MEEEATGCAMFPKESVKKRAKKLSKKVKRSARRSARLKMSAEEVLIAMRVPAKSRASLLKLINERLPSE